MDVYLHDWFEITKLPLEPKVEAIGDYELDLGFTTKTEEVVVGKVSDSATVKKLEARIAELEKLLKESEDKYSDLKDSIKSSTGKTYAEICGEKLPF